MLEALSTSRNRTRTFILLAICCVLAASALAVGVSDNPPGILLAYCAATALVLAFVHPWRTARQFMRLFCASVLGFVVFAILHNVCEGVADEAASVRVLQIVLQSLAVATFLLAVMICPPAILVGAIGSVAMFIRNRRRRTRSPDTAANDTRRPGPIA